MKTLLLLRHAKSSWKEPGIADFERPLNNRGREAAEFVGRFIAAEGLAIDLVISSPAVRARQTTELVVDYAGQTPEVRFEERIYEASPGQLLEIISQIEDNRDAVLLVGHNPGMEQLLKLLVGAEHQMSTATLAKISLGSTQWNKVTTSGGTLESIVNPKEIKRENEP